MIPVEASGSSLPTNLQAKATQAGLSAHVISLPPLLQMISHVSIGMDVLAQDGGLTFLFTVKKGYEKRA